MSIVATAGLFFLTALLYAAVGFGGGSTYNALLVLAETDYRIMPVIALLCNLIVVSGGTYRFARAGHLDWRRIAPWVVASVPAAWLGGYVHVSEKFFVGLLGISLFAAAVQLLFRPPAASSSALNEKEWTGQGVNPFISAGMGAALGFLAGLVGIGGGIFLAPVLYFLRWAPARKIAGACSFFILVNSLAGLAGQAMKLGDAAALSDVAGYWLLFPAVLIGGQIGSYMGAVRFRPEVIRLMTALLILYAASRLLWRWWGME